jgi:MOSC domain-containing protein YiiM
VHLIPKEILDARGVAPGQIGENVTTAGIDLLSLGKGTKLHFLPPGPGASGAEEGELDLRQLEPHPVVVVQGLRNPCPQIDKFRAGLKESFVVRDGERKIVGRLAGVMGTVEVGGVVSVGMRVVVEDAEGGFEPLGCV